MLKPTPLLLLNRKCDHAGGAATRRGIEDRDIRSPWGENIARRDDCIEVDGGVDRVLICRNIRRCQLTRNVSRRNPLRDAARQEAAINSQSKCLRLPGNTNLRRRSYGWQRKIRCRRRHGKNHGIGWPGSGRYRNIGRPGKCGILRKDCCRDLA